MPQATTLRDRAAAFRPRFVRDAIVLGRNTILARRAIERGCYCIEKPDDDALIMLLSLAYEKRIHRNDPILLSVLRAADGLLKSPEHVDALLAHVPEPSAAGIGRLPEAERLLKAGTRPADLEEALRRDRLGLPEAPDYAAVLTLCEKGVVLGNGTVIATIEDSFGGGASLALKGRKERILALLSVAAGQAVDADVLAKFEDASRALKGGNVNLAAIHLAHVGLPPLAHTGVAKALGLAADEMDQGTDPFELLKGLDLLPTGMGYADWSSVLHKESGGNPNHVPACCPEGGQFCSADGDGTSGKYGTNTKLDVIKQKIREALQSKKAIALVGGANDDRPGGPIKGIKDRFESQYRGATVEYFSNTEKDRLTAWIADQSKQFGNDNVAVVGHSYGGDTAAKVVAAGSKVGGVVSIDPVSVFSPNLDNVRSNAATWINVNANPDDATRDQAEMLGGNTWAGFGAWNSSPAKYATQHYNANMKHFEAYKVLLKQ